MDESPGRFPPPPETPHGSPPGWGAPGPASFYPLDPGRIISLTLSLFRFRRATFIAIALAFQIPIALANGLVQAFSVEAIARWTQQIYDAVVSGDVPVSAVLEALPWPVFVAGWVASTVLGLLWFIGVAALIHAAGLAFAGSPISAAQSIRAALSRLKPLTASYLVPFIVVTLVAAVGGAIATALFLAGSLEPGLLGFLGVLTVVAILAVIVFLSVRWTFAPASVMLENLGGMMALGRSWRLVAGSSWRVLGYTLLFGLLVGLPAALISYLITAVVGSGVEQTPVGLVATPWQAFLSTFLIGAATAILAPITAIAITILYFDVRSRHGEVVPVPGQAARSVPEQQL